MGTMMHFTIEWGLIMLIVFRTYKGKFRLLWAIANNCLPFDH